MTTAEISHPALFPEDEGYIKPRYDLSQVELDYLEGEILHAGELAGKEGVVATWIDPTHVYANFIRTHEARYFPEVTELDPSYDSNQQIFALVDTRPGKARGVVHSATLMGYQRMLAPPTAGEAPMEQTGFYTIDSLIKLGNFTAAEFVSHYEAQGVDLEACIAVETNFKINSRMAPYLGLGSAELAYITIFNTLVERGGQVDKAIVFATINSLQRKSLGRVGIDNYQLMGRSDLRTEEAEKKGIVSLPVAIPLNAANMALFQAIDIRLEKVLL